MIDEHFNDYINTCYNAELNPDQREQLRLAFFCGAHLGIQAAALAPDVVPVLLEAIKKAVMPKPGTPEMN